MDHVMAGGKGQRGEDILTLKICMVGKDFLGGHAGGELAGLGDQTCYHDLSTSVRISGASAPPDKAP